MTEDDAIFDPTQKKKKKKKKTGFDLDAAMGAETGEIQETVPEENIVEKLVEESETVSKDTEKASEMTFDDDLTGQKKEKKEKETI